MLQMLVLSDNSAINGRSPPAQAAIKGVSTRCLSAAR
jgi:hypothetical protein